MSATGARPGGRPGPKHGPFSLIGGDVSISGNITATVDLHIDGHVEGDIRCAALVQGPDSCIHGHVMARSARLAGLVDGSITAEELIVEATAQVTGDISYERITIEPGARIEGRFAHQNGEAAATELKLIANENAA